MTTLAPAIPRPRKRAQIAKQCRSGSFRRRRYVSRTSLLRAANQATQEEIEEALDELADQWGIQL